MGRPPLRLGVVGAEHLHLFEMVDGLVRAGVETVCHAVDDGTFGDLYAGYRADSQSRDVDGVLGDDSLELVVLAGIPADRADVAVAALGAGHHVLAAKPAVTTHEQLDAVAAAATAAGRRWWAFFSERLCNRAVVDCVRLVRAGDIGDVVAISGAAPHTLAPDGRPDWFFDPTRGGGVLVDLAAHQADQLLALAGPGHTEVRSATIANVATPDHPALQDVGRMSLRHTTVEGRTVLSDHHVDWLSPPGLGTWGDVRLVVTGTVGTAEVRANIDPAGEPGGEHLIVVGADAPRRIDTAGVELDWAERLIADVRDGSDRFIGHDHTVAACRIVLDAQRAAEATR